MELRMFLGHYTCGFEDHMCRRAAVSSPAGEPVDVEVAPVQKGTRWALW
ncbi:MAG TPA: hypothetical protein VD833_12075 [Vicinamibacterales bacterium]|nr:hypothetical protein [Vicinamibacterales bacterium]